MGFGCRLLRRSQLSPLLGTPLGSGVIGNSLEAPRRARVGRPGTRLATRQCSSAAPSASQHLPGGRGRGKPLAPSTGSPPRGARAGRPRSAVLAGLERSRLRPHAVVCFPRPGRGPCASGGGKAPALAFGYCSRSDDTVGTAGARCGGGSLAGGT